jgi:cell fate (sporulation/competence/biofilm development) regulator YmcA (YheA/YmcA/DUF963 family)
MIDTYGNRTLKYQSRMFFYYSTLHEESRVQTYVVILSKLQSENWCYQTYTKSQSATDIEVSS